MRTFRSLAHRNYRLYFLGQVVSLTGSWMQTTAIMWLAYERTHQSRWPAYLMAAQIGPTLLLGAFGGALADRVNKLRLILTTQVIFLVLASVMTALVYVENTPMTWFLALMVLQGIIQAIDLPSRLAFVPELVPREDLRNAVALNSLLFNVARATGPAVAAVLIDRVGVALCSLLNALSYFAVLAALAAMRDLPPQAPAERTRTSGFRILRTRPKLAYLILLAGAAAVSGWPLLSLLPAYVHTSFAGRHSAYGVLMSMVGVGALVAALLNATYGTDRRQRGMLSVGVGTVAIALLGLSMPYSLPVAAGLCMLFGFGMILFFSTGQAAVQLGAPPADRGKVMGIWAMLLSGGVPLGNFFVGPAADELGVTAVLFVQAIAMTIVTLIVLAGWRVLRPGSP